MSKFFKKLLSFITLIIIVLATPMSSFAADYNTHIQVDDSVNSNSNAGDGTSVNALYDIYDSEVINFTGIKKMLFNSNSYVTLKENNGRISPFWNTPNLAQDIQNIVRSYTLESGFGHGHGTPIEPTQGAVKLTPNNPKTAMDKYGFELPIPTYYGEIPVILINPQLLVPNLDSFHDVIDNAFKLAHSVVGAVINFFKWIFHDQSYVQTAIITPPSDENFDKAMDDMKYDNFDYENGKDPKNPIRIMPYDFSALNAKDKELFSAPDPRSDMQNDFLFRSGTMNMLKTMIISIVISTSGKIANLCVALNNMASFKFIEDNGIDPTFLWVGTIATVITIFIALVFIFLLVKYAVMAFMGRMSYSAAVIKSIGMSIILAMIIGIIAAPTSTYNTIKSVYGNITGFSNIGFSADKNLDSMISGSADNQDKSNFGLWLPYFNTWTVYMTNHTILDSAQTFIADDNKPETKDFVPEKIVSDKESKVWVSTFANTFTTKAPYNKNIYRVIDHFLAPRISDMKVTANGYGGASWSAQQNENYNGYIQSSVGFGIGFQLIMIIIVVIKVAVFFELIINIIMAIVNISVAVTDFGKLKATLLKFLALIGDIAIINIGLFVVIYFSIAYTGWASFVIFVGLAFATKSIIKSVIMSRSIMKPAVLNIESLFRE